MKETKFSKDFDVEPFPTIIEVANKETYERGRQSAFKEAIEICKSEMKEFFETSETEMGYGAGYILERLEAAAKGEK